MSDFDTDKAGLLNDLQRSRAQQNEVVSKLSTGDLSIARRGSCPVSKILDHVLHSERLYAQLISVFTGLGASIEPTGSPSTSAEALTALEATRKAVTTSSRNQTPPWTQASAPSTAPTAMSTRNWVRCKTTGAPQRRTLSPTEARLLMRAMRADARTTLARS
jgi:DinB family